VWAAYLIIIRYARGSGPSPLPFFLSLAIMLLAFYLLEKPVVLSSKKYELVIAITFIMSCHFLLPFVLYKIIGARKNE
jgi:drug/metabolite transporter (DMT)-like permease